MVFDPTAAHVLAEPSGYDPHHPDAVEFMHSTPEILPAAPPRRYYSGETYNGDPHD